MLAVATSAVRDAVNRERLLGPLRRDEGVEVRILSGQEEARLGAVAALHSLLISEGVVADLGGGSLQLTRVRDRRIASSVSLPLGAVRTTQRYLRHDPPTSKELRSFREAIASQLFPALPPGRRGEELVGLGGAAAGGSPSVAAFLGGTMADAIATTEEMDLICAGRSSRSCPAIRARKACSPSA